jgi:RNA polymerase sigma-70 factor (sigma-E family)
MDAVAARQFGDFVAARGPALLRTAYALTGNQHAAEDLVQAALAKTMLRWSRLHGDAEPYVRRVLVNEHISWWRRRRGRPEILTAEPPEVLDGQGREDAALRMAVRSVLATLPPRQRAVVVLRYLEDLSERQVADLLGVSPGTVASQASRALATLRARMPQFDGVEAP